MGSVRYASGTYRHYYPFGEEVTSTAGDQHKFAELYRDADTGLDYAMARYYSCTISRFTTADAFPPSAARPASWNRYGYVLGDPVNLIDPTGLVEVPPLGPVPHPQCITALLPLIDLMGYNSPHEFFNSPYGIMGLTMYMENQGLPDGRLGSLPGSRQDSWIGIGWVFLNRWSLSDEQKRAMGFSTGSLIQVIQQPTVGSQVWNGNNLVQSFQDFFIAILRSDPASQGCRGLTAALVTAIRVIYTYYGIARLAGLSPAPNNVGNALQFASGSSIPSIDTSRWTQTVTARWHSFTFFSISPRTPGGGGSEGGGEGGGREIVIDDPPIHVVR
jgi:RHS repeat-associated protein